MTTGTDIVRSLRAEIDTVLVPLIAGHDRHICLIDAPNHPNVGDSAILLGELAFLQARFPHSRISCFDTTSYSERCEPLIDRASLILIHGGGNFGDIWPRHHDLRMRVLQRFSGKRIIQLPQSLSFADPARLAQTARAIAAHNDFHLIARDVASQAIATGHFSSPTWLAPDMAFWADLEPRQPERDAFCLLRSDKEAVADHAAIVAELNNDGASFEVRDWLSEPLTPTLRADRRMGSLTRRRPGLTWPLMPGILALRRRYARARVTAGTELLCRGRTVVTDRLHAHIMCCVMGIPNLVFDSLDGKISALYHTWTHTFGGTMLIDQPDHLRAALAQVLDQVLDRPAAPAFARLP